MRKGVLILNEYKVIYYFVDEEFSSEETFVDPESVLCAVSAFLLGNRSEFDSVKVVYV